MSKENDLRYVKKYEQQNVLTNLIYLIYVYKEYLASINLQWLIGHKTQPKQVIYI